MNKSIEKIFNSCAFSHFSKTKIVFFLIFEIKLIKIHPKLPFYLLFLYKTYINAPKIAQKFLYFHLFFRNNTYIPNTNYKEYTKKSLM
jgi:hypothetical protein